MLTTNIYKSFILFRSPPAKQFYTGTVIPEFGKALENE